MKKLIELIPEKGIGVEVGVMKGKTSDYILKKKQVTLYLIDTWDMVERKGKFYNKDGGVKQWYKEVLKIQEKYKNRCYVIKQYSEIASYEFDKEYFDFIIIDADHSYLGCYNDLIMWFPKLKPNGILIGHDYDSPKHKGVTKAFNQFAQEHDLQLNKANNYFVWCIK